LLDNAQIFKRIIKKEFENEVQLCMTNNWIKKNKYFFVFFKNLLYICTPIRELSSAGSEHLPYKQGVASSNLAVPTLKIKRLYNQMYGRFFMYAQM
jgi:hypothetical protein